MSDVPSIPFFQGTRDERTKWRETTRLFRATTMPPVGEWRFAAQAFNNNQLPVTPVMQTDVTFGFNQIGALIYPLFPGVYDISAALLWALTGGSYSGLQIQHKRGPTVIKQRDFIAGNQNQFWSQTSGTALFIVAEGDYWQFNAFTDGLRNLDDRSLMTIKRVQLRGGQ